MLRKGELISILAIVSVSMARLRLVARFRRRFARWTLFHGGRSALCVVRCQNRVEGTVTAITSRRDSAANRRQKRLRSLYFRSPPGGVQEARRIARAEYCNDDDSKRGAPQAIALRIMLWFSGKSK